MYLNMLPSLEIQNVKNMCLELSIVKVKKREIF